MNGQRHTDVDWLLSSERAYFAVAAVAKFFFFRSFAFFVGNKNNQIVVRIQFIERCG